MRKFSFLILALLAFLSVPAAKGEDTPDYVQVDAAETTAYFTWPTDSRAQSYQIDIYKDANVFCHLTLGDNGQLLGISFNAPDRKHTHDIAETFSFLVTGLETATRYHFVLSALDSDGTPLHVYIGDFATTGYTGTVHGRGDEVIPTPPIIPSNPEAGGITGTDNVTGDSPMTRSKRMDRGRILILHREQTYTLQGQTYTLQ